MSSKSNALYIIVLALCAAVNLYVTVKHFIPLGTYPRADESYTYVGDDYPEHLPVEGARAQVTKTFQKSENFAISGPGKAELWHSVYPEGYGFVRLGDGDRILCTAMFHQLHCLEKMRILLDDPHNKDVSFPHQQHCLNYLRQLFLCKADVTLEPIPDHVHGAELDEATDLSMLSGDGVDYECGDSEILYHTTSSNFVSWKSRWNHTSRIPVPAYPFGTH